MGNTNIKRICVFASASKDLDKVYYEAANRLGELIAENGYDIVYGGSHRGLMYACAGATQRKGGNVYAVMPEKLADMGFTNPEDCKEFYITKGMRERKAKLDEISDAVISIAGGFGTLEEISEMIVQKQLGYNTKPIVFLNTNGFYDHLIKFMDSFIEQGFAYSGSSKIYYIAKTPEEAIEYIQSYVPDETLAKFARL